jgi:hypothetical protein
VNLDPVTGSSGLVSGSDHPTVTWLHAGELLKQMHGIGPMLVGRDRNRARKPNRDIPAGRALRRTDLGAFVSLGA